MIGDGKGSIHRSVTSLPRPLGVISWTNSSTVMFSKPFCLTISKWSRFILSLSLFIRVALDQITFAIRFHLISPSVFHQSLSQQLFHSKKSTDDEGRTRRSAHCSRSPLSINLAFKEARIWALRSAMIESERRKRRETKLNVDTAWKVCVCGWCSCERGS